MKISLWKLGYACLILAAAAYAFYVLRGPHGLPGLMQKQQEVSELEKQNEALHREIEAKRNRLTRLRDNPAELELEIRGTLNLVKKGEKMFVVQEKSAP